MNASNVTFFYELKTLIPDQSLARKALAYATAISIARYLPFPSSLTESQSEEFNNNLMNIAFPLISKINEMYVIDTDYCQCILKAAYMVRLFNVYPQDIMISEDECINCDVFHISQAFSGIDLEGLNEVKPQINSLIRKVNVVIRECN